MADHQTTIPNVLTPRFRFVDADPNSPVAVSRRRVIETMKDAAGALNAEVFRLESTGKFDEAEIDRTYARLLWAVQWFEEERTAAELDSPRQSRGHILEVA